MKDRFEVVQDPNGRFSFQLRAADGATLLSSLACDSKIMAQSDLLHTRNSLRDNDRVIEHQADDGTRFVVIKDRNGAVLARSPHVDPTAPFAAMLDRIRSAAQGAPLVDLTKRKHSAAG